MFLIIVKIIIEVIIINNNKILKVKDSFKKKNNLNRCNLTVSVRGLAPNVLCAFFATARASLCLSAAI